MTVKLTLDHVTVHYPIFTSRDQNLRNQILRVATAGALAKHNGRVDLVTALDDVSLSIGHGDRVGIVGHNGSGKSTLLRTMAGIFTPICGTVSHCGRIATVLQLAAGVEPEETGYDNIVRLARLYDIADADIERMFHDIAAFTQLGRYLALPLRTYSTGMLTRLLFAVATATRPDILLIDELIATGDDDFQRRASARVSSLIDTVGILVLATHSKELITRYCNRFVRLDRGHLTEISASDLLLA